MVLTVGEVHTGLLQHSTGLPPDDVSRVLAIVPGERVRRSARPIAHAVSPDVLTGVDCPLATRSGRRAPGAGTTVSRALITGGHVLQASTRAVIEPAAATGRRRLPWSHYLTKPGVLEHRGAWAAEDLVLGFLSPARAPETLDLGAIATALMDDIQLSPLLDAVRPFTTPRTRLRWALVPPGADGGRHLDLTLEKGDLRTLRLTGTPEEIPAVVELCEDLALHDWLLSTLLGLIERADIGGGSWARTLGRLRPAVDTLLHLWMPAARLDDRVLDVWEVLERRPGLSRQWHTSVSRVRDQLAMATVTLLAREAVAAS
ncbi:SCO2521 family protein [Longispora sp. NPDC051575]|uniref:SCO2521 family protein n=1 Tax=Longispora sp. NPDC051575 TaxID=3154943 RepID=UPI003426D041